jgi:hypothetical protein
VRPAGTLIAGQPVTFQGKAQGQVSLAAEAGVDAGAGLEGGGVDLVVPDPVAHPGHATRHQCRGDQAVVELGQGDLVAERFEAPGEVEGRRAMLRAEAVVDAEGDAQAERDPQPTRFPCSGLGVGLRRIVVLGLRRLGTAATADSAAVTDALLTHLRGALAG